jgi:hypothetical protein
VNQRGGIGGPVNRLTTMNTIEKSKTFYFEGKAFVSRHPLSSLVVILIILEPIVWLAMRSMENTLFSYRCGTYDYPCHVNLQPEPKF